MGRKESFLRLPYSCDVVAIVPPSPAWEREDGTVFPADSGYLQIHPASDTKTVYNLCMTEDIKALTQALVVAGFLDLATQTEEIPPCKDDFDLVRFELLEEAKHRFMADPLRPQVLRLADVVGWLIDTVAVLKAGKPA